MPDNGERRRVRDSSWNFFKEYKTFIGIIIVSAVGYGVLTQTVIGLAEEQDRQRNQAVTHEIQDRQEFEKVQEEIKKQAAINARIDERTKGIKEDLREILQEIRRRSR